jgi:hypothetical protein
MDKKLCSLFRRYERSDIFIDVGLRDAFLEAVLEPHVYAMDILSLWDIAAGTVEVYVYQCIYGFLRSRVFAAVRRSKLDWDGPLLVHIGSSFVLVQGCLILRIELVHEAIHTVTGRRNDICVASLIDDPTPMRSVDESRCG